MIKLLSMRILILIGHGEGDKGAVHKNFIENELNKKVAQYLYNFLVAQGFKNITLDKDTNLQSEIKLANQGKYDLILSIHFNAGGGDGFECFYYTEDKRAKELCYSIEKEVKSIGQNSRGVKNGNSFAIIKNVAPTSIILEGAFLDNKKDMELFDNNDKLKKLGIAYAKGIMKHYGINIIKDEPKKLYKVQVGAFTVKQNAIDLSTRLKKLGFPSIIVTE